MHKCEKCGYEAPEDSSGLDMIGDDEESSLKDEVLSELQSAISESLSSRMKPKESSLSVEMLAMGPKSKKPEDEEEDEY